MRILTWTLLLLGIAIPAQGVELQNALQGTVMVLCRSAKGGGSGSGFIIGKGDVVVTNAHVIDCGGEYHLVAEKHDSALRLIWKSNAKDLALLRIETPIGRKPLAFAPRRQVREADTVYALGFPGSANKVVDRQSMRRVKVSRGIISAAVNSKEGVGLYQTDAAINPGSSGGPLVDEAGNVVGISSMKALAPVVSIGPGMQPVLTRVSEGEGIGWAVQSDELLAELGRLGIPYSIKGEGLVEAVAEAGPAQSEGAWQLYVFSAGILLATVLVGAWIYHSGRRGSAGVPAHAPLHSSSQPSYHKPQALAVRPAANRSADVRPANVRRPGLTLRGLHGPHAGQTLRLQPGVTVFGRDPGSTVLFDRDTRAISRRHCILKYDPGAEALLLEDAGSRFGTFLVRQADSPGAQGQPLQKGQAVRLRPGDAFYLSDRSVLFAVEASG